MLDEVINQFRVSAAFDLTTIIFVLIAYAKPPDLEAIFNAILKDNTS